MSRLFAIIFAGVLVLGTAAVAGMFWLTEKQHGVQQADKRAGLFLQQGQVDEATAIWQKLLDENAGHVTLLNRLGIASTQAENYDQAESYFRRAMQLQPEEPQAYFNLALLRMRQERMDQARQMLLELLEIANWYPEANYHLGYIYEKTGQPGLARQYYIKELNVNGDCAKAWRRYLALNQEASSRQP